MVSIPFISLNNVFVHILTFSTIISFVLSSEYSFLSILFTHFISYCRRNKSNNLLSSLFNSFFIFRMSFIRLSSSNFSISSLSIFSSEFLNISLLLFNNNTTFFMLFCFIISFMFSFVNLFAYIAFSFAFMFGYFIKDIFNLFPPLSY